MDPIFLGNSNNQPTRATASQVLKDRNKARRVTPDVKPDADPVRLAHEEESYMMNDATNFKRRASGVTYSLMRRMAAHPLIGAIIQTRQNQVLEFVHPQRDKYSTGFKIVFSDREKRPEEANARQRKEMKQIEDFIKNCGRDRDMNRRKFSDFTKMVIYDSLSLDQLNFEVRWARDNMPHSFYPVDAGTIRRVVTKHDLMDNHELYRQGLSPDFKGHETAYVKIYQDRVIADFYEWELAFGVRNPRTDIRYNGYGVCELEEIVNVVTGLLWSFDYNLNIFKNGSHHAGAWRVSEDFSRHQLNEFKKVMEARAKGVHNAHRDLFIQADQLEWIDLQKSNRDMEYNEWNNFLVKLACSRYQIDPSEVNFPVQGGFSADNFEEQNEQKIKHSKDKGLKPLLRFYASLLNEKLVSHFYGGEYELEFAGLDSFTRDEEQAHLRAKLETYMTINEIRAEQGLPPIKEVKKLGDIIMNSTFTGHLMGMLNVAMEQQMEAEGDEAEPTEVTEEHMDIVAKLTGDNDEAVDAYAEGKEVVPSETEDDGPE